MKTVNTQSTLPPDIEPAVPSDPAAEAEYERLREERKERVRHLGGAPMIASTVGIRLADPDRIVIVEQRR